MGKRNRFDTGRLVVAVICAVMVLFIPLRALISNRTKEADRRISSYLDEFTSHAQKNRYISVDEYEKLLSVLNSTGTAFKVELGIEREARLLTGGIPFIGVSAHVHSPECYIGHNHTANGCRFHSHTASCYCSGTFRRYLRSESGTYICYKCLGRGQTGSVDVCPTCRGVPPDWSEVPCSYCDATGTSYEEIWVVCPYCDGAGCDVCDEGKDGGWYKWDYVTCPVCNGSLKMLKKIPCSTCGGSGQVGEIRRCDNCNGTGTVSSSTDYYSCDICGQGDSSSYGITCGRRICGMDFESYECGIVNEDTRPVCDRIIVDANYTESYTIRQFDTSDMIDKTMIFTYLDGSTGRHFAKLAGESSFDSSTVQDMNLLLQYTGYFERADKYETRYFPITVRVQEAVATCPKCLKTYYLNDDGRDPGCPYCPDKAYTIKIVTKGDVVTGEEPVVEVYAVSDTEQILLDKSEYDLFYDTDSEGIQQAAVYYHGIWKYFPINVVPDPDQVTGGVPGPGEISVPSGPVPTGISVPTGAGDQAGETDPTGNITTAAEQADPYSHDDTAGYQDNLDTVLPEYTVDMGKMSEGRYMYIPDEEIVSEMYTKGVYVLQPGDMLNITAKPSESGLLKVIVKKFFVPGGLKEKYSSGIVI